MAAPHPSVPPSQGLIRQSGVLLLVAGLAFIFAAPYFHTHKEPQFHSTPCAICQAVGFAKALPPAEGWPAVKPAPAAAPVVGVVFSPHHDYRQAPSGRSPPALV